MLRDAVAAGTELGKKADSIMKAGQLVPDEVVIGLIENYCFTKEKMDQEHHGLFIIDFLNPMVELCLQLSLDLLLLSL